VDVAETSVAPGGRVNEAETSREGSGPAFATRTLNETVSPTVSVARDALRLVARLAVSP
jgi:hypothetical protein